MAEKEYIERGAVLKHQRKMRGCGLSPEDDYWDYAVLAEDIESIPAADVVEVVHARWINPKNGNATCSHCQFRQRGIYDDDNEQNFCGVCGAKMDGGKNEKDSVWRAFEGE